MRPKEQLTVKVFSPCGLIGEVAYLKVSLIRLVLAEKEENLNRCLSRLRSTRKQGTQRECGSKPLQHSIVERILVFKR